MVEGQEPLNGGFYRLVFPELKFYVVLCWDHSGNGLDFNAIAKNTGDTTVDYDILLLCAVKLHMFPHITAVFYGVPMEVLVNWILKNKID